MFVISAFEASKVVIEHVAWRVVSSQPPGEAATEEHLGNRNWWAAGVTMGGATPQRRRWFLCGGGLRQRQGANASANPSEYGRANSETRRGGTGCSV